MYGRHKDGTTVIRKSVLALTVDGIADIVDPVVRARVHAASGGLDPSKAFANERWPTMPSGIPIKRVRISKSDKLVSVGSAHRERLVKPNGNSHLELFVNDKGDKLQWRIVSRLDAYRRRALNGAAEDRLPPAAGWRFLMVLRVGDMLMRTVTDDDGEPRTEQLVLENISTDQIEAKLHHDARPAAVRRKTPGSRIRISSSGFLAAGFRRIAVDALGSARPSHD